MPSIVKIDVEGFEIQVLRGFREKLPHVKLLIIEGGEREKIVQLMRSAGFVGPYFYHHKVKKFLCVPQRRIEDPVFINRHAIREFLLIGLKLEELGYV